MTAPKILTDTRALQMHRARARIRDLFLQVQAADEIQDRLEMVNRAFTRIAVVTPFEGIWRERLPEATICADDETLPLDEKAFDLVIHSMSLHWANDPVGQLIQCRRALRPDGMLIAVALGGQTLDELRRCLGEAEIALTGGLSPRIAPMGEIRDLGALLQRAGLALPVADSLPMKAEYRDARHLMHDLRAMGETSALAARPRNTAPRALFDRTADLYHQHFATPAEKVTATFEMVFLTGWAPDDSQQKPLRPGSAKERLADALRVPETRLPD
ncbi:methyltransferase domain-containing protein [Roseobacter ponti]|uniref:Methyltransferase domain-containing protein n=1 Tax=Roseobacter ponti TaxID=1891787 RepID=A0A858SLG7_9RHOB|nr:methyltransferase domain-containing protein [Roseobacter ponti]QJF49759.1 methyltransferase domain-containing protein [Roseobacter ponti]